MKRTVALLIVLAVGLSGCGSKDASNVVDEGPAASDGKGDRTIDELSGFVFDAALAPVVGASIELPGENLTATTGSDGYYGFRGLPQDRVLVAVARADGFVPLSKSVTLTKDTRHMMNFTLAKMPVKEPYMAKQTFTGNIPCSALVRTEDARYHNECDAAGTVDERIWEFNVNQDLAGLVIEVFWEPTSELADHLNLTVETVNLGIFDEILSQNEGPEVLRGQVSRDQADRFYRQGGTIRVTVDIGRNIEDEEMGVGAALAFQQGFQVIASEFYVAGPPPGYTSS